MKKVGFIGLGAMGKPMARNLLKAGYPVNVCDLNSDATKELSKEGAHVINVPCDVAKASEVVITMLPDSPEVEAVYLDREGLLSGAHSDLVLVDCSTVDPATIRRIGAEASKLGIGFLGAPVGGGVPNAIQGNLIILVGGEDSVIESCRDIFETVGERVIHAGPLGDGNILKLSQNLLVFIHLSALIEGFCLAKRAGLDMVKLLDLLKANLPRTTEALASRIMEKNFDQGFKTRLAQKDVRVALKLAQDNNVPLPHAALTNEMFKLAIDKGLGDLDLTALLSVYEK